MEGLPILLFGGFFVLIVVLGILGHFQEKKRRETLRKFAEARQWYFESDKVRGFDAKYLRFDFLDRGRNRYAHNIVAGTHEGYEIEAFDYHYETRSRGSDGKRKTRHHRFSVAVIGSPFPLRDMTIRPEGVFDKLSAAFGWDDIDFESAEFSRKFHVKAQDRRWAYDVLNQRAMAFLLESPQYEIHFAGPHLALRSRSRFEPWEFAKTVEMGTTLLDGIPGFAKESI